MTLVTHFPIARIKPHGPTELQESLKTERHIDWLCLNWRPETSLQQRYVNLTRIKPVTPSVRGQCSYHLATWPGQEFYFFWRNGKKDIRDNQCCLTLRMHTSCQLFPIEKEWWVSPRVVWRTRFSKCPRFSWRSPGPLSRFHSFPNNVLTSQGPSKDVTPTDIVIQQL